MYEHKISWMNVLQRLRSIDQPGNKVYGVPRGGMIVAGFLQHAENMVRPDDANIIVDDIIDSGRTRDRYTKEYPDKQFYAIIDKQGKHAELEDWVVFPWENEEQSQDDIIIRQLQALGEDPEREGLKDTPSRVIRSWGELYSGYTADLSECFTVFEDPCDELVLFKNIEMYSMCEHHMLPFFGVAHIAYIPDGRVIGVSKLARILEVFARRLQIQERIGIQVVEALMKHLKPLGAACLIEAQHFCVKARGVQKQSPVMTTSCLQGVFKEKPETRAELLQLIRG